MQDWANTWKSRRERRRGKFHLQLHFDRAHLLKYLGLGALVATILGIFLFVGMFAYYARYLPNPDTVVQQGGYSTKILDRNGNTLYDLYQKYDQVFVPFSDIPVYLREATISIEDKNFYTHPGYDVLGILRGFSRLFTSGRAEGGSTLTQQLVKNQLLTNDRTLVRKFKELVLAIEIERKFTKDQILQMYLNDVPYGGTAVGIGAASQKYFGVAPKDLNLVQAVILAGMPQAPSLYSPYGSNPKAYVARATAVLKAMQSNGYITAQQESDAEKALPLVQFQPQDVSIKAPHFVFYVKDQLVSMFGENFVSAGGYTVTTTLDSTLQDFAQQTVATEVAKVAKYHIGNGAAMVMNPQTGEILAMVGSKDYFAKDYDGQVNVVMSLRQPGSSIKPVTYAAAFSKGYSPATMVWDVPTKFPGATSDQFYEPGNYDGKYHGPVQLRYSLASSLNIPAVKLLDMVGLKNMMAFAYQMGFDSLQPTAANLSRLGLSVTLGGGEVRLFDLVHAYSAFANGGDKVDPISILKVEKDGKTIYQANPGKRDQVVSPEVAFLIDNVLSDNNARLLTFGPNSYLNMNGLPIAVKTGTTNDKRDNWTIGWSTNAVVGVWVGNNDNSPMTQVASGVTGASPIWRYIMQKAWDLYKGDQFTQPSDIVQQDVDAISGYPAHDGFPSRQDYFIQGTVPTAPDPVHTNVKVCKSDHTKLANDADVARNYYDNQEFIVAKDDNPLWQSDIPGWLATQTDPRYQVPTQYCGSTSDVTIGFDSPHNQDSNLASNFPVHITVGTNSDVDTITTYINGTKWEVFNGQKVVSTTAPSLAKGTYELKAHVHTKDNTDAETIIHVGVQTNWDASPSPTPTPSPSPTPTLSPSPSPSPSPTP